MDKSHSITDDTLNSTYFNSSVPSDPDFLNLGILDDFAGPLSWRDDSGEWDWTQTQGDRAPSILNPDLADPVLWGNDPLNSTVYESCTEYYPNEIAPINQIWRHDDNSTFDTHCLPRKAAIRSNVDRSKYPISQIRSSMAHPKAGMKSITPVDKHHLSTTASSNKVKKSRILTKEGREHARMVRRYGACTECRGRKVKVCFAQCDHFYRALIII